MPTKKGKSKSKTPTKTFRAKLERAGNLGWTVVHLPFNVCETWGTRAQIRIRGEVNGFPFRTSAFPTKRGVHFVMINRKMQKGGKVVAGMIGTFCIEPDMEKRVVAEPMELLSALKADKQLSNWYQKHLSYSARNDIAKWVGEAKQAKTRARRAEQMAERLFSTMDAERELPPIIRRAMDENPKAYVGWKRMTPAMRRAQLLGIFYYRNPGSQQRRLQKAIDLMLQKADSA